MKYIIIIVAITGGLRLYGAPGWNLEGGAFLYIKLSLIGQKH